MPTPTPTARELEMFERFRTEVQLTHNYPTKYGNFKYANADKTLRGAPEPSDGAFFEVTPLSGKAVKTELGGVSTRSKYPGILSIRINVPADTGETLLNTLIEATITAFKQKDISGLWYLSPYPTPRSQANGWVQRTVQCPYRFFN